MRFYQYWILLIAALLIFITLFNIFKIIERLNRKSSLNDELSSLIRNLLISVGLLSITLFIFIYLLFV